MREIRVIGVILSLVGIFIFGFLVHGIFNDSSHTTLTANVKIYKHSQLLNEWVVLDNTSVDIPIENNIKVVIDTRTVKLIPPGLSNDVRFSYGFDSRRSRIIYP